MDNEGLLAEVEDLIRNAPDANSLHLPNDENYRWLGGVAAVVAEWSSTATVKVNAAITNAKNLVFAHNSFSIIMVHLHQAQHDLRMKTIGTVNVAIAGGMVFNYFDELRKIIETATEEVFFIDPYLDADFVSRYLGNVRDGVRIRLLAQHKLNTLRPAVELFSTQQKVEIELRSSEGLHDRYLILDKSHCYQSGASFKDGARNSMTTLTEIIDVFPAILASYEELWDKATAP